MTMRSPRRARIAPVDVRLTGVAARAAVFLTLAFLGAAFVATVLFTLAFLGAAFVAAIFLTLAFLGAAFVPTVFFAGIVRLPTADGSLPIKPVPILDLTLG